MRPLGLAIIGIGILMISIGIIGSQSSLLNVFKGIPAQAKAKAPSQNRLQ